MTNYNKMSKYKYNEMPLSEILKIESKLKKKDPRYPYILFRDEREATLDIIHIDKPTESPKKEVLNWTKASEKTGVGKQINKFLHRGYYYYDHFLGRYCGPCKTIKKAEKDLHKNSEYFIGIGYFDP